MKLVVQCVLNASVSIENRIVSSIDRGYLVFVSFTDGDNSETIIKMVHKLVSLRIFPDENGKTNLSIKDINGSILSVSQFTLYASVIHGNRPSFTNCLKYDEASKLYDFFNEELKKSEVPYETGEFGADMKINLINDGPFTLILDSKEFN